MITLTGKTTNAIRRITGHRDIQTSVRAHGINMLFEDEDEDLYDICPIRAGAKIDDVVGLVELDLWLYSSYSLDGNQTVWIFDDGVEQHVYDDISLVPGELERAVRIEVNKKEN